MFEMHRASIQVWLILNIADDDLQCEDECKHINLIL